MPAILVKIFTRKKKAVLVTLVLFTTYMILSDPHIDESWPMKISFLTGHCVESLCRQEERCTFVHECKEVKTPSSKFPLIVPHVEPTILFQDTILDIVVVVNSACLGEKHRLRRSSIRQTWGSTSKSDKKWKLYFSLGLCGNEEDKLNTAEASQSNDIIIGNFTDSYRNVRFKTFMALYWVSCRFSVNYVMKTDDDMYVRIPRFLDWLKAHDWPAPFYGGFVYTDALVARWEENPWYVSYEEYSEKYWPPFAIGACEVFSADSILWYLDYTQTRPPFTTDDAYLGVAAKKFGIPATHIPDFKIFSPVKTLCDLVNMTVTGDSLNEHEMLEYHKFYMNQTAINDCLHKMYFKD